MDGTAVEAIAKLAQEAAGDDVMIETGERELSTIKLHNIPRPEMPDTPGTLTLHSLHGLVDYVTENRDELVAAECMIHVESPTSVAVVSKLADRAARHTYVRAEAVDLIGASFLDRYHRVEEFIVALLSRFEDEGQRADLLAILGNITEQADLQVQDDGVSQTITTRSGMKAQSPIPNPVALVPFRTFREVNQVRSPFVFRMKRGGGEEPTAGLFEADGGAWELDAVQEVHGWLAGQVEGFAVIR